MKGALIGDIIGSVFEFNNYRDKDFNLFNYKTTFTDDSVLTLALAKTFLDSKDDDLNQEELVKNMQEFARTYAYRGYGGRFYRWIYQDDPQPYNSFGNGSAMRVSPVAYVAKSLEDAKRLAKLSAEVTHNHPEGIKGAEAIASAIYLALNGATKEEIKDEIKNNYYDYDFGGEFTIDNLRPNYYFAETCQESVPHAIEAFLEGESFEDVIRTAISLGGDSDTIAAMAGPIAEAYYGIPEELENRALNYLYPELRMIVDQFAYKYKRDK